MIREKVGAAWGWILAALLILAIKAGGKPKGKEKVHWTKVEASLRDRFPKCDIKTWDEYYRLPTTEDMRAWMRKRWLPILKMMKYLTDIQDCDDFMKGLLGIMSIYGMGGRSIGYLIVKTPQGGHAVIILLDPTNTIWVIEPQQPDLSKAFFSFPKEWQAIEIRM